MNIPIYRAKKIDSDEYVEGYYSPDKNYQEHIHTIFYFDIGDFNVDRKTTTQIDPTTLAIHFPDMLDSQGNKIFASLQENKKHGDIIHNIIAPNNFGKMIVYWNSHRNAVCYEEEKYCTPLQFLLKDELKDYKIIGIQE